MVISLPDTFPLDFLGSGGRNVLPRGLQEPMFFLDPLEGIEILNW
jgi:hypothetical protein